MPGVFMCQWYYLFASGCCRFGNRARSGEQTLFLECADSLCADLHAHFYPINDEGFLLQVGFPDFFGVALGEADIAAVLLSFAGEFTLTHQFVPSTSKTYFSGFYFLSQ